MRLKLKVGMTRGPVLRRQEQSFCINTELKRFIMTESLSNVHDISRTSQAFAQSGEEGEGT